MSSAIRILLASSILLASAIAIAPLNGKAEVLSQLPPSGQAAPQTTATIYAENLAAGWGDWSYSSSVTIQDPAYHHAGSYSASCAITSGWGALFFGTNTAFSTVGYDNLIFWINGGAASGQSLDVNLVDAAGSYLPGVPLNNYLSGGVTANTWKSATIPLADLQAYNSSITGVVISDNLGAAQPRFYVDDMTFQSVANPTPSSTPTNTATPMRTWTGTPPTATRTNTPLPMPTPNGNLPPIPAGLPSYFSLGLFNATISDMHAGVPYNYRYQYLAGGVNTGQGWQTWQSDGRYAASYIADARAANYIPGFIYYNILQSGPNYNEWANLQSASGMRDYYNDWKVLMQQSAGSGPVFVNVEPDLDGVMMQDPSNTNDDAALQSAKVGASGMPDVAGIPDTFRGFWQALAHLRDLYAPNVILGQDLSIWGPGDDLTIALRNDPNYDWQTHADRVATYHNSFGPGYTLNFFSPLDRDAAYYQSHYGSNRWWDDTDTHEPKFSTFAAWLGRIDTATNRRALMWQVPNGNRVYRSENNTDGHYQDNRAEYFLNSSTGRSHMAAWGNYGVIGVMFGAGAGGQSHYFDSNNDGVTNPPAINGNNLVATLADDDGGFIRLNATTYYAGGPVPLPGGGPIPTATPTHTGPTATPTRSGPTATPTRPRPTNTPAPPTPTFTPGPCGMMFMDVRPTDYFYNGVVYLYCHGAITGYGDNTFRPSNNTTRGQLSKIVVLAEGMPLDTTGGPHFRDVPTISAFYSYVETAYNAGIISGYSDGTFRPNNNITRAQLCKVIVQAQNWSIDPSNGPHFSDVSTGNTFYGFIETAYNHGVIAGYADGTFHPNSNATRGQISKIVYNAISAPR